MSDKEEFHVSGWWGKTPEYVITALRSQLEAAQAVWPELQTYALEEKRRHSKVAGSEKRA